MTKPTKIERHDAQAEEMVRRGYITVAAAAERALRNVGCIYRALARGKLNGTQVGDRKYVADDERLAEYLGELSTERKRVKGNGAKK